MLLIFMCKKKGYTTLTVPTLGQIKALCVCFWVALERWHETLDEIFGTLPLQCQCKYVL